METSKTDYAITRPGTPEEGSPPNFLPACLILTALIKGYVPLDFAQNK